MAKKTGLTKAQLKDKVRAIMLLQGNDFIKELLRDHGLKIGTNKTDFAYNIAHAIDQDQLTGSMIEEWLSEIEGWGNQYVYLFKAPAAKFADVAKALLQSPHAGLLGASPSYAFPPDLELSSIGHDKAGLSLVWHLGKHGWDRVKSKDFVKQQGLETYRFEAYRQRMDRSVVRFEWRYSDGHCAILIHRNKDIDHSSAMGVVWSALKAISVSEQPCEVLPLIKAVKSASKQKGTKSTRLEADGGFVDLVSTLDDGGIDKVAAVRQARHAMNDNDFARAQGLFSLGTADGLKQQMSVQVFGAAAQLRLFAQCRRDDVHAIIAYFLKHNAA